MSLNLPVSLGEALDKLSILDIKLKKISDNRRSDVQAEYDLLSEQLLGYLSDSTMNYYYSILMKINLSIWDMQDDFRYNGVDNCIQIIEENDRRFRVKKKINDFGKSKLREQKGYRQKSVFVLGHLGLGDHINCIGLIRYLSTSHDRVTVVCKKKYLENIESFFEDDKSIDFMPVENDHDISPRLGYDLNKFKKICNTYTNVYLLGIHKLDCIFDDKDIPFNFYDDAKISRNTFWDYFHLPDKKTCVDIPNEPYVFVHNTTSTGKVFDLEYVAQKTNISFDDMLYVNPCVNMYKEGHKFYNQAQKYVNLPFIYYKDVLKKSTSSVLSDSSFFCMSLHLNLKNSFIFSRDNRNYEHLIKKCV